MALIDKLPDGKVTRRNFMNVMYVPLTEKSKQLVGGWDSD